MKRFFNKKAMVARIAMFCIFSLVSSMVMPSIAGAQAPEVKVFEFMGFANGVDEVPTSLDGKYAEAAAYMKAKSSRIGYIIPSVSSDNITVKSSVMADGNFELGAQIGAIKITDPGKESQDALGLGRAKSHIGEMGTYDLPKNRFKVIGPTSTWGYARESADQRGVVMIVVDGVDPNDEAAVKAALAPVIKFPDKVKVTVTEPVQVYGNVGVEGPVRLDTGFHPVGWCKKSNLTDDDPYNDWYDKKQCGKVWGVAGTATAIGVTVIILFAGDKGGSKSTSKSTSD